LGWAEEMVHDFSLHALDLKAVAAGHCVEFFRTRVSTDLNQPSLDLVNAFLRHLEFLIVRNHITRSARGPAVRLTGTW
jgi:hypothetical protein